MIQVDVSQFVFLTHWKPHSAEKIHLTCSGLLSRNSSRDGCVNIAQPASLKGMGSVKEKLNPDAGFVHPSKEEWASEWTRPFPTTQLSPTPLNAATVPPGFPVPHCVFSCSAPPEATGRNWSWSQEDGGSLGGGCSWWIEAARYHAGCRFGWEGWC